MLRREEIKSLRSKCPICGSEDLNHCQMNRDIKIGETTRFKTLGEYSEQIICKNCGFIMDFVDPHQLEKRR